MKFNLGDIGFKKITQGFMVILGIALINVVVCVFIIQKNKSVATSMVNEINPYMEALEEFNHLVTESKMFTTNWVYLQYSETDKESLVKLHETEYPALKIKLLNFVEVLHKKADSDSLHLAFQSFEDLMDEEKKIMRSLVNFDDYENPNKKLSAEEEIESTILPRTEVIQKLLKHIIGENKIKTQEMKDGMIFSFRQLFVVVMLCSLGLLTVVLFVSMYIAKTIKDPVLRMKQIVMRIGKGELPEGTLTISKDVIGEMSSAVNVLSNGFIKTSLFADEIGRGNLSAEYYKLGDKDMLGNALINMRNSLKAYSEDMEQKVADRTREVVEKNQKLKVAYEEIHDSITYARRIQEAILPSLEAIGQAFPDSFVLYRPKDIVCGDFYWFAQKGDENIIACLDCTGHGVPGALMTVVGNSLMNQIVNEFNVTDPAEILSNLDKKIIETLKQKGGKTTNDGMDASICNYNSKTSEMKYCGAKRPLYVFKENVMEELKGDKFPIGSSQFENEKVFITQKFECKRNDTIYLFSDGYPDQFGGMMGKKFMTKQFREILTQMQDQPMQDQYNRLDKELTDWKGSFEQTDDVLVIGLRF